MLVTAEKNSVSGLKTILVLLYAPGKSGKIGEEIYGRTKIEKLLFLLKQRNFPITDYEFEAYDYGPCTFKLYDDLEVFKLYDWIKVKPWKYEDIVEIMDTEEHGDPHKKVDIFSLTDKGLEKGKKAFESLPQNMRDLIISVKKEFNSKSLVETLRYIYETYPEYSEKSLIKNKIFSKSMFGSKKNLPSFKRESG